MSSKNGKEIMAALKKRLKTLWKSKFHNTGGTHDVYNENESRAEHDFYHEFQKWSHAGIVSQYPVLQYRLDFLVYWKEHGIGVEIDGAKYHDVKKDKIRDIRILHGSEIDAIVRFNASDAIYNPSFCVYFLRDEGRNRSGSLIKENGISWYSQN